MNHTDRVYSPNLKIVREYKPKEYSKIKHNRLMELVINIDQRKGPDRRIIEWWGDYLESVKVPFRVTIDPQHPRHGLVLWKERRA